MNLKQRHWLIPACVILLWCRDSGCITGIIIARKVGVRAEINWLADQRIAREESLKTGGRLAGDRDDGRNNRGSVGTQRHWIVEPYDPPHAGRFEVLGH